MGGFSVSYTTAAFRDLEGLEPGLRRRIADAVDSLSRDPFRPRPGCDIRKLKGAEGYALRVGQFRVLYSVEGREVVIVRVLPRKVAYR